MPEPKLTIEQMYNAHFAHCVALDPQGLMPSGDPDFDRRAQQALADGREVLLRYSISYSPRYANGCQPVHNSSYQIVIQSGWLATNAMVRVVTFREK